jgi:hypothetical protein
MQADQVELRRGDGLSAERDVTCDSRQDGTECSRGHDEKRAEGNEE